MSVPNLRHIVDRVYARGGFDLTKTKDGQGEFTRAVCMELHSADRGFVMLKKKAPRTRVKDSKGREHAADAVLYAPTGQSVDVIVKASPPTKDSKVGWDVDKVRYTPEEGFAPDYGVVDPPAEEPTDPSDLAMHVRELQQRVKALEDWRRS